LRSHRRRKIDGTPFMTDVLSRTRFAAALLFVSGIAAAHPGNVDANGCHRDAKNQQVHCHPVRAERSVHAGAEVHLPPQAGDEGVFHGSILRINDGDSLHVLVRGRDMEFRLADIDAPEHDQPYGRRAKRELVELTRDRDVILVPRDTDRYGRTVARLWVGDVDVNRELVKRGAAWFYAAFAEDPSLYDVEQAAREAGRGLWALPLGQRVEPWQWRKQKRELKKAASGKAPEKIG
jgi:micrococcal nuclease